MIVMRDSQTALWDLLEVDLRKLWRNVGISNAAVGF
jgi:hypothetical protein